MHTSPAIFSEASTIGLGVERGVGEQRLGGGEGVGAAGADADDAVGGLDDVAGAADDQAVGLVGHRQHRLQAAQHPVGAPLLGQLDHRPAGVVGVLARASSRTAPAGRRRRPPTRRSRSAPCPPPTRRILTASCLATVAPSVTCPSPPRATTPSRRTLRIVVDRAGSWRRVEGIGALYPPRHRPRLRPVRLAGPRTVGKQLFKGVRRRADRLVRLWVSDRYGRAASWEADVTASIGLLFGPRRGYRTSRRILPRGRCAVFARTGGRGVRSAA